MDYRFDSARVALKAWFDERAPRERLLLVVCGGMVLVALVYSLLWEPAWTGRAQVAARLPGLQAGLETAHMQLAEARRLRVAAAVRPPAGAALRDALAASLTQSGIARAQVTLAGKGVQVDAKDAPFAVWMAWLDTVRREDRVRVVSAHADGSGKPGVATVSATLEPQSD